MLPRKVTAFILVILLVSVSLVAQMNALTRKIKKEIQTGFTPDGQGKLVSDSSVVTKQYDLNGNVLEEIERSIWPLLRRSITYRTQNFFRPDGKLDSTLTYMDGNLALRLQPMYDSAGREAIVKQTDGEGRPSYSSKNIYDASNRKSRVEMYEPDGKLYNFTKYVYDAHGNILDQSATERGTPRYRWAFKYDKKNRLVERRDYSGQGVLQFKHRYEYDKDGRLTRETTVTPKGTIDRVVMYRYEFYEKD